jgi:hypothetical protein
VIRFYAMSPEEMTATMLLDQAGREAMALPGRGWYDAINSAVTEAQQ